MQLLPERLRATDTDLDRLPPLAHFEPCAAQKRWVVTTMGVCIVDFRVITGPLPGL